MLARAKRDCDNYSQMSIPTCTIREIIPAETDEFRRFCQVSSEVAYTRPEFGITPEMLSAEVFDRPDMVAWYAGMCAATQVNKAWIAEDDAGRTIGTIGAEHRTDYVELHSFYVAAKLQGQGLGRKLFNQVVEFAGELPIRLDVIQYMDKTIEMYKRWGFEIDETAGKPWFLLGHDWPEEARQAYQGIYMVRS